MLNETSTIWIFKFSIITLLSLILVLTLEILFFKGFHHILKINGKIPKLGAKGNKWMPFPAMIIMGLLHFASERIDPSNPHSVTLGFLTISKNAKMIGSRFSKSIIPLFGLALPDMNAELVQCFIGIEAMRLNYGDDPLDVIPQPPRIMEREWAGPYNLYHFKHERHLVSCDGYLSGKLVCHYVTNDDSRNFTEILRLKSSPIWSYPQSVAPNGLDIWQSGGIAPHLTIIDQRNFIVGRWQLQKHVSILR